jgi:hypothetical protein
VVKVASAGFVGPAGVVAVADAVLDEDYLLELVLSSPQAWPMRPITKRTPTRARTVGKHPIFFFGGGGADTGAGGGAVGPQVVPSKYLWPPLPSGSGYQPASDLSDVDTALPPDGDVSQGTNLEAPNSWHCRMTDSARAVGWEVKETK